MTTAPATTSLLGPAESATQPEPVVAAALAILDQCGRFVARVPDQVYAAESRSMPGGTVGKHVRHTLDHFAAALGGIASGTLPAQPIEYDRRARNVPMESVRRDALAAITSLRERAACLTPGCLASRVSVRVMLSGAGDEASLHSTLARELFFATHHAIHHHAMMKTIAAEFGVETEPEFGKAPSTLHAQRPACKPSSCGCQATAASTHAQGGLSS